MAFICNDSPVPWPDVRKRIWWRIASILAYVTSGAAFLTFLIFLAFAALGSQELLDEGDKIASIGSLLVGVAALVVAITSQQATRVPSDPDILLARAQCHVD